MNTIDTQTPKALMQTDILSQKLIVAVSLQDVDLVEKLIKEGADVNYKTCYGYTVLMNSVDSQNINIIKLLIAYGADIHAVRDTGETALYYAATQDISPDAQIVKLLLEHGANVHIHNSEQVSLLSAAIDKTLPAVVERLLLAGADVNKVDVYLNTPIIRAVQFMKNDQLYQEKEKILDLVLQYKPDLNVKNLMDCYPLTITLAGNIDTFHKLLKAGANPFEVKCDIDNLLTFAFRHQISLFPFLFKLGLDYQEENIEIACFKKPELNNRKRLIDAWFEKETIQKIVEPIQPTKAQSKIRRL